jgi:signal transduction histidine kinase
LATLASILVARQLLLHRLDQRINRDLVQEVRELRALATGNDPGTGRPFGNDARTIFEVFLDRNIPSRNEAMITFVDGRLYQRSRRAAPYALDTDPGLAPRWAELRRPERSSAPTPAGTVEYLAVPLNAGGRTRGVFVVAFFRDLERRETDAAFAGVALTGSVVLVFGSVLAWLLAERILGPVRSISRTARSISESDLSRRINVQGNDELATLAETFNDMLDRLQEAFAAQKQLVDDAGHELRTPITIVRGHLETLEAQPQDRAKVIALVLDELERMGHLVEHLLLLARSETPNFLDLDIVDVGDLTQDVFAKATAIAPRDWVFAAKGQGRIVADRQRLTQALLQLAQNATQHTADADRIEIGSKVAGENASFWVTDTGSGIDPADRQRIFERFERGRRPGQTQGAGLGLSIVRAISRAHRGHIELDSVVGLGATFRLIVPVDQPHEDLEVTSAWHES